MTGRSKTKLLFWSAAALFFINAATFLIMPLMPSLGDAGNRASVVIIGLVFWLSLIGAIVLVVLGAAAMRREYSNADPTGKRTLPGVFAFFSNKFAVAADVVLIISAICMLILILLKKTNVYLAFVVLFVLILSFYSHCMLNGRIFNTLIKNNEKEIE